MTEHRIPRAESDPIEGLPMKYEAGMPWQWACAVVWLLIFAILGMRLWDAGDRHHDERRYYERMNRDAEFCEDFATDAVEWRRCMDVRTDGVR